MHDSVRYPGTFATHHPRIHDDTVHLFFLRANGYARLLRRWKRSEKACDNARRMPKESRDNGQKRDSRNEKADLEWESSMRATKKYPRGWSALPPRRRAPWNVYPFARSPPFSLIDAAAGNENHVAQTALLSRCNREGVGGWRAGAGEKRDRYRRSRLRNRRFLSPAW